MSLPIKQAAAEHPESIAFDDGLRKISYAELTGKVSKHQSAIASLPEGQHVAWCPRNDWDAFATFWAIQQHGCVACPISHRFPDATRKEIVERMEAFWLPDVCSGSDDGRALRNIDDLNRPATIILSSGSTGPPKAIVHNMAAHIASASGAVTNMPLLPSDRWLWSLPLFHVSGLSILIRCAVAGATVVGVPDHAQLSASLLAEQEITHLSVVNTQLRRLLQEENFPSKHLKAILLGGGRVDDTLVSNARKRGVAIHTTYGLTEMASQVTTSTADGDPRKNAVLLPGRELMIGPDNEILVRGQTLCLGYFVDGEIRPVVDEQGWFHTGDLAATDTDQQLTVLGRADNMFVSGGENIYPENIERAITKMFDVQQVVVVPRADKTYGDCPVAFVDGTLPTDWQTPLRQILQSYEIPVEILAWPANIETGIKPNRKQMEKLASQP